MRQKRIDFAKLLKDYKSGWVAISHDFTKVIFAASTLHEVRQKTKNSKEKIYYFPAGESYDNFVGVKHEDNSRL